MYRSRKKRDKKGRRGRSTDSDTVDEELQEELNLIQRPVFSDLLPFAFVRLLVRLVCSIPDVLRLAVATVKSRLASENYDETDELPYGTKII